MEMEFFFFFLKLIIEVIGMYYLDHTQKSRAIKRLLWPVLFLTMGAGAGWVCSPVPGLFPSPPEWGGTIQQWGRAE